MLHIISWELSRPQFPIFTFTPVRIPITKLVCLATLPTFNIFYTFYTSPVAKGVKNPTSTSSYNKPNKPIAKTAWQQTINMAGNIKLGFISAVCFFLWVHTDKDKNASSFVTQQTLLILWFLISTLWHILHPQELGPSNCMNNFFFPPLKEHSSTWKILTLESIVHQLIFECAFGPRACSFSHCGQGDFWVPSQNFRIFVCNSWAWLLSLPQGWCGLM